jgi:hypothetical protein
MAQPIEKLFNKHFWEYYLTSFCWWISSSCENHCILKNIRNMFKQITSMNAKSSTYGDMWKTDRFQPTDSNCFEHVYSVHVLCIMSDNFDLISWPSRNEAPHNNHSLREAGRILHIQKLHKADGHCSFFRYRIFTFRRCITTFSNFQILIKVYILPYFKFFIPVLFPIYCLNPKNWNY